MKSKIEKARRMCMTAEGAANAAGISCPTLAERERNPGRYRLKELAGIYSALDYDAKEMFIQGVIDQITS